MAHSYEGLGDCFLNSGDVAHSIQSYEKALEIFVQELGRFSPHAATCYMDLGTLGLKTDPAQFKSVGVSYSRSLEYIETALNIRINVFGPTTYQVANSCYWLGQLLYFPNDDGQDDIDSALGHMNRAIGIYIDVFGDYYQELPDCYWWKGRFLEELNRIPEAIYVYQQGVKIEEYHPGKVIYGIKSCKEALQSLQSPKQAPTIK